MQFPTTKFSALIPTTNIVVAIASLASVSILTPRGGYLLSLTIFSQSTTLDDMKHWLATTDAVVTFVGPPLSALSVPDPKNTTVIYCSSVAASICGGSCMVYTGGSTCISAPSTACLSATNDVAFCTPDNCTGPCNVYNSCGTPLEDGFCYTPDTNSILVGYT